MRHFPRAVARICSLATILTGLSAANVDGLTVDLTIFNGLAGQSGGQEVEDPKETSVGAFTVANSNDTDANTTVDSGQGTVPAEVDLMQMIIRKPSKKGAAEPLTLRKIKGPATVYTSSTKGTVVTLPHDYTYEELPQTVWVEAGKSATVRDIEFEITYNEARDNVKATGIWATKTGFKNLNSDAMFSDAGTPLLTLFSTIFNTKLGIQLAPAPTGACYGMCMEFTVSPPGIGGEPNVAFDITRQKRQRFWTITGSTVTSLINAPFPAGDLPNDETAANDDNDPTPLNDHIYSLDGPGTGTLAWPNAFGDATVTYYNFFEFVRLRLDGTQASGNVVSGSRCSDKAPWHARISLRKNATTALAEQNPTYPNDVAEGHVTIGATP
jgi:hypothetical protein